MGISAAKIHAPSVVQKNIKVRSGFAWRLDRLVRKMDRSIDDCETSRLFAPDGRRQDDLRARGCFRHESILNDEEEVFLIENAANARQIRQRDGRIGG